MANVFPDLLHSYGTQLLIHTTPDEQGVHLTCWVGSATTARILAAS